MERFAILVLATLLCSVTSISAQMAEPPEHMFARGDSNADGRVDLSDAVFTLSALLLGGPQPVCEDAADANADGMIDVSDPIATLSFLFQGGSNLPYPGAFGFDHLPANELPCAEYRGTQLHASLTGPSNLLVRGMLSQQVAQVTCRTTDRNVVDLSGWTFNITMTFGDLFEIDQGLLTSFRLHNDEGQTVAGPVNFVVASEDGLSTTGFIDFDNTFVIVNRDKIILVADVGTTGVLPVEIAVTFTATDLTATEDGEPILVGPRRGQWVAVDVDFTR